LAAFQDVPATESGARVVFEWLPGERFVIQRREVPIPEAPGGVLKLWRDAPDFSPLDFSQRYVGVFSGDGNSISGAWEIVTTASPESTISI
jgi:hypothetical protein